MSVERADGLDIKSCCCLEKLLYLRTVFSNDSDIVATCFAVPVLFYIERSEFAEAVCGKQNLIWRNMISGLLIK